MGKKVGDAFEINQTKHQILAIS
ncbi:hypothetical protein [Moheibacter lacus]